jgi:hypothetical protein
MGRPASVILAFPSKLAVVGYRFNHNSMCSMSVVREGA